MKTDKGSIVVAGISLRERAREVLKPFCEQVFISLRISEADVIDQLSDDPDQTGPAAALLSAYRNSRDCDWLVLACDFPFVTPNAVRELIRHRDQAADVICFSSAHDSVHDSAHEDGTQHEIPQPLFAVWTPQALAVLEENVSNGKTGPNATLKDIESLILKPSQDRWLMNANDPETLALVISTLESMKSVGQER